MNKLKEDLSKAGVMYDGHVTNRSIEEQMKIVIEYINVFTGEIE